MYSIGNRYYNDIINLPHHISTTRPQMSMMERAAQFSPFAALTGYDAAIRETGRLTDRRIELNEDAQSALDLKLRYLSENMKDAPEVTFTYFKPDERKKGGAYVEVTGVVKKMDEYEREIVLRNGTRIPVDDILCIDLPIEEQIVE